MATWPEIQRQIKHESWTWKGETIASLPDELLSKEELELKAQVLHCKALQKAAAEKKQAENRRVFYKALGLA